MRALPKDNLAYPILIRLDTGSMGTGCMINCPDCIFLATAKHVLFDQSGKRLGGSANLRSYTPDLQENDCTQITIDLSQVEADSNLKVHAAQDVCLIKIFKRNGGNWQPLSGVNVDQISSVGICGINIDQTAKLYADVMESNDIYIFGYPVSIGLKSSPQFNSILPLLRKGIVAGRNDHNKTIIIDCPVYKGNSGGPVIEVEMDFPRGISYKLIGLVIQFIPVEEKWYSLLYQTTNTQISNSGYSVVVPVDFVREVIDSF